jgi:hypothetical protein
MLRLAALVFLLRACATDGYTRDEQNVISTHYGANTAGFSYVGCFRDNGANRDLEVFKEDSVDMTPHKCNTLCKGYDYFAVQITQCYCDNSYGSVQEPTITEGQLANKKWYPGSTSTTVAPAGITSLENAMGQSAYETHSNTLGGVGIVQTETNKYVQEGCYHECGGASEKHDSVLPCGGLNRNSVYRRPSTMPSACVSTGANHGHPLLASRGLCDPPQGALHTPTMPPCKASNTGSCSVDSLSHEEPRYTKPWEKANQLNFQTGHQRDNIEAKVKTHLMPDMLADESYMVHS